MHLLDALCIDLGFCVPPTARDALLASPPECPAAFADAVFQAEGLDPAAHRPLYRQVLRVVTQHLGQGPSGGI